MKICKDCKKEKEENQFYGIQGECKDCTRERVRENRLQNREHYQEYEESRKYTFERILDHKYSMMKMSVEGRNSHRRSCEGMELCSKNDFLKWCKSTKKEFNYLYKKWKDSGYQRKLSLSIDRIDNNKGYTIDNIQWLTLSENIKKNAKGRVNAKRNKKGQFIKQKLCL